MTSDRGRRSDEIGQKIFKNVSHIIETTPLTADERDARHGRPLGNATTKLDGMSWGDFYDWRLSHKPGFADEVANADAYYHRFSHLRPQGWLISDTAEAAGVSADDILPTAAIDAPAYREARLAIAPRGLDKELRVLLWTLEREVGDLFRTAARLNPELAFAYVREVEKVGRKVEALLRHEAVGSGLRRG